MDYNKLTIKEIDKNLFPLIKKVQRLKDIRDLLVEHKNLTKNDCDLIMAYYSHTDMTAEEIEYVLFQGHWCPFIFGIFS